MLARACAIERVVSASLPMRRTLVMVAPDWHDNGTAARCAILSKPRPIIELRRGEGVPAVCLGSEALGRRITASKKNPGPGGAVRGDVSRRGGYVRKNS